MGAGDRRKLVQLLDAAESWRELASVIKKANGEYLITSKILKILEDQKHSFNNSPSQILLDYWATTGRKHERPTIRHLLETLKSCKLFRAADFVTNELLRLSPLDSPATAVDKKLSDDEDSHLLDHLPVDPTAPSASLMTSEYGVHYGTLTRDNPDLEQFSYIDLMRWTDNFCDTSINESGHKIGEGAFGAVYKAITPDGRKIAIKVLKEDFGKQFLNEVSVMSQVRHENLLQLVGISFDGLKLCMIMDYLEKRVTFQSSF